MVFYLTGLIQGLSHSLSSNHLFSASKTRQLEVSTTCKWFCMKYSNSHNQTKFPTNNGLNLQVNA